MRGHEGVILMRRSGYRPQHVSLTDAPGAWHWTRYPEQHATPAVFVDPMDTVARLDLRFLVGLTVFVDTDFRAKELVLACESAGAEIVFGVVNDAMICTKSGGQEWRN